MVTESAGAPEPVGDREQSLILERLYRHRFSAADLNEMRGVWRVLVQEFFQSRLRPGSVVVDVGAGPCLFINEVHAARRIALDANPEVVRFAGRGWRLTSRGISLYERSRTKERATSS